MGNADTLDQFSKCEWEPVVNNRIRNTLITLLREQFGLDVRLNQLLALNVMDVQGSPEVHILVEYSKDGTRLEVTKSVSTAILRQYKIDRVY